MTQAGAIDFSVEDCIGELTINNVGMHRRAWNVLDHRELWPRTVVTKGSNVDLPAIPGQRPYPLELDQRDVTLDLMISGLYDVNGNPDLDGIYACQLRNYAYLRANVIGPVDGVTSTWDSYIDFPWGDSLYAAVQVLDIAVDWAVEETIQAKIDIRIPAGEYLLIPGS